MNYYLVFDIGGTFIKWAIIDSELNIIRNDKWAFDGKKEGKKVLIQKMGEKILKVDKEYEIKAIGISTAGTVDPKSKKIVGQLFNIKDMDGLDFPKELKKFKNIPVFVENDANAATIGESTNKELQKYSNILMITLGTGIGGGIIIDKKLYHGGSGMAGEIGNHIYHGERWEYYYSSIGLLRMIKEKNKVDISTYDALVSKDKEIIKTLDEWYEGIAHVLANMIIIMNFEAIIIGGGISESKHFDLERVRSKIINYIPQKQFHNTFKLYKAKLGNSAAIIGMAKVINDSI